MSNKDLFQICQEGDLDSFQQLFEQEPSTDINAKDVHGMSALAYSARNGQVDLVRELLQRGAEKHEVMEQGYGLNNAEIAGLLQGGEGHEQSPQHNGMGEGEGLVPVQMEDGSITYLNPTADFSQGYGMPPPQFGGPQFPHHFFPMEGMHASAPIFQPGNGMANGRRNHSRKESGVNLPPPDVARMIPCKYFPNCKYGDKCVFAHPIPMGAVPSMPPQGHPLSPSMSHPPPMQPMFYGQMPPGYLYQPFGTNPQQFLPPGTPMGHPAHMSHFNGVPQHFGGQSQGGDPQVQDAFAQSAPVEGENIVAGEQGEQSSSNSPAEQNIEAPTEAPGLAAILNSDENVDVDPSSSTAVEATEDLSTSVNGKPVHRRQSFNSFLHHHAVPFQPQSHIVTEMNGLTMDGTVNGFVPRSAMQGAGKARRMNGFVGGVNGNFSGKRGNHSADRPPCTFFQSGRCKYGDECRFPHILADGTDARPLHAQQRTAYPTQYSNGTVSEASPSTGASNEQTSRSTAVTDGTSSSVGNANAPASAPTGPQADKKSSQHQPQLQSNQSQQQQQATSHSRQQSHSSGSNQNNTNVKDNKTATQSNGVVRSNPSKTSVQANGQHNKNNNNNASGSRSNKKHNNNNNQQNQKPAQPSQRVPTVNDFPALASPNPNGTSPSPSAAKAANGSAEAAINDANAIAPSPSTSSTPAAPARVNFSAILSAPAPVKQVKNDTPVNGVNGDGEPSSSNLDAPVANGKVENGEESKPTPTQAPKTHASVAAAAAAANAATNGVPTGTTVKAQSQNVQAKASNGHANEGGVNKKQQQKQANGKSGNNQKANGTLAPSASAKTNGAPTSTPAADDDFQLVNRSRHSSNKRSAQSNGHASSNGKSGGETYTPQAKAVAA